MTCISIYGLVAGLATYQPLHDLVVDEQLWRRGHDRNGAPIGGFPGDAVAVAVAAALGVVALVLFAATEDSFSAFMKVLAPALLFAAASLATGGLFGFLFGVPRTLTSEGTARLRE